MLSLIGILAGFVVVAWFLTAKRRDNWTALFLSTTVLTSITGFLFPIPQIFALTRRRHRLLARLGADDSGSVLLSSKGSVAPNICHRLRHRSLSQRFCFDRPAFHEGSRAQGPGTHAIRAAVSRDAGRGHVDFYCPWGSRGQALPGGSRPRSLSVVISFAGLFVSSSSGGASTHPSHVSRKQGTSSPGNGLTVGAILSASKQNRHSLTISARSRVIQTLSVRRAHQYR